MTPDNFDPLIDVIPEVAELDPSLDFADADRLGRILGLSRRHIFRLAREGVLCRETAGPFEGRFRIVAATAAYVEHATRERSRLDNRLAASQAKLIDAKLARQARHEIAMADALVVVDAVIHAFNLALAEVGRQVAAFTAEPDRAESAIESARRQLAAECFKLRRDFMTGGDD